MNESKTIFLTSFFWGGIKLYLSCVNFYIVGGGGGGGGVIVVDGGGAADVVVWFPPHSSEV